MGAPPDSDTASEGDPKGSEECICNRTRDIAIEGKSLQLEEGFCLEKKVTRRLMKVFLHRRKGFYPMEEVQMHLEDGLGGK